MTAPEKVPFSGKATGRTAAIELGKHNFGQLDSQSPQIEDVIAQGDTVVAMGSERGRLRESKQEHQMTWLQRFRFSGQTITHFLRVSEMLRCNAASSRNSSIRRAGKLLVTPED